MKLVFVSLPYACDPAQSEKLAARLSRQIAKEGHAPLPPQVFFSHFLEEPEDRESALQICQRLVVASDELRVYGTPTEGMLREIEEARRRGIPVLRFSL